jgi:uncharacterized protein (TIGR02453 family)
MRQGLGNGANQGEQLMPVSRKRTPTSAHISAETFRFFRDLKRHNSKDWMDEHRDRYQAHVVDPLRDLFEELAPAMLKLYSGFDVSGRTGVNFSRINRDIRFARDKTPYRPQMYLSFPAQGGKGRKPGELYVGFTPDFVTLGFRVYVDRENKAAALGPVLEQAPAWCARQKRRLARQYESYWYSMEKGEWTKHEGWPVTPGDWKKLLGWVVRRKLTPAAAAKPDFSKVAAGMFVKIIPLFRFVSQSE